MINSKDIIYTVSEINYLVKETIESTFEKYLMVEGEISQIQQSQLGHIYITLKDEKSSVKCTLWNSRILKIGIYPELGLKAIIKCKITFYEKTGSYQLDIIEISSASVGKFHEIFEKLKLKLKNEGLFDIKFKKNLPKYTTSISIITSLSGSVLQDIIKILTRRSVGIIIEVYGCNVQGANCAASIIKQLKIINEKNSTDLIIIARGGGSLEDLIEYNNELLARHIYNSSIPIITAIGHETDTTVADLVSDIRAATPSEAAEIATRLSSNDILNKIKNNEYEIETIINKKLSDIRYQLKDLNNTINQNSPINKINNYSQTVDIYYETLKSNLLTNLIKEKDKINLIKNKLKDLNPKNKINKLELCL